MINGTKKANLDGLGRMSDNDYKELCMKHAPHLIEQEHHELDHLGRLSSKEYKAFQEQADSARLSRKGGWKRRRSAK